jgi:hypothetical protein
MSSSEDPASILPPSLDLPPHLSAHKYFFVCTLTVAAWDTLVLAPRSWRLFKKPEWSPLKIAYHFMRWFMPIEFTIVGVAFFDTKWDLEKCQHFYLFEPICTAILLAVCSAVHVIRINAIYDKSRKVLSLMGALFATQIVVTAICCGFYRVTPLEEGQGCIAEPKHNWVGLYWLSTTLLYTASFVLALAPIDARHLNTQTCWSAGQPCCQLPTASYLPRHSWRSRDQSARLGGRQGERPDGRDKGGCLPWRAPSYAPVRGHA